jgi:hypothetical protein
VRTISIRRAHQHAESGLGIVKSSIDVAVAPSRELPSESEHNVSVDHASAMTVDRQTAAETEDGYKSLN